VRIDSAPLAESVEREVSLAEAEVYERVP
jgi:hypothetical protein